MSNPHLQPALHRAQMQLDRLADGSVILDRYSNAWQSSRRYWYRSYGDGSEVSSWELAQRGPIKTVWEPK